MPPVEAMAFFALHISEFRGRLYRIKAALLTEPDGMAYQALGVSLLAGMFEARKRPGMTCLLPALLKGLVAFGAFL